MKKMLRRLEEENIEVEELEEELEEELDEKGITEGEMLDLILTEINNKTYNLIGTFDEKLLADFKAFASQVYFYENDPHPTLTINISSRGGQVDVLLAILDTIETLKEMWECKVHCNIDGYAFSSGALLFLIASDTRSMGTNGQMMLHEMSYGVNSSLKDHKAELAYTEKLQKRINKLIAKNTPITEKMLNKWYKQGDVFFFKEDCEELGILTSEEEYHLASKDEDDVEE